MPHMMPMMWMIIHFFTLFFLLIIISLLYFFYIPNLSPLSKFKKSNKFHKWTWMW